MECLSVNKYQDRIHLQSRMNNPAEDVAPT